MALGLAQAGWGEAVCAVAQMVPDQCEQRY
jgi:hypothetical protein